RRFQTAFDDFRQLFPRALCYIQIVPVDEAVTLTLHHREDEPLGRLMLDDAERARLDRLWDELEFGSQEPLAPGDGLAQLLEYASQDSDPRMFEPFRKPINDRAAAFRQRVVDVEPRQLEAVIEFANRAYRRPLTPGAADELRALYARMRAAELPHEEALRLT